MINALLFINISNKGHDGSKGRNLMEYIVQMIKYMDGERTV